MAAMSSSSSRTLVLEAFSMTMMTFTLLAALALADDAPPPPPARVNLTLHNLCPYPVWPLVTANAGLPSIADDEGAANRLDGNGEGLATLAFPPGAWSGRVVARTGCRVAAAADEFEAEEEDEDPGLVIRCATGDAPPVTVAQVSVGGPGGLAAYSVSLVDGFNVAAAVTPHGFPEGRRCPTLGCAADLAADCPPGASPPGGGGCGAGGSAAAEFKARCPDTRTNATDVEATAQDCAAPREIKVVFCPTRDSVVARGRSK